MTIDTSSLASRQVLNPTPLQTFRDTEPANGQNSPPRAGALWAWQQQAGALPPDMGTKVNLFA
jgi:hypothetical protein